jgi:hypothetical protein
MNGFCIALVTVLTQVGTTFVPDTDSNNPPAWIEQARQSTLPLYCDAVKSELWATRDEAKIDVFERAAVRARDFAAEVAPPIKRSWETPTWMVQDYLLREPVFIEEVEWTYGPMYRAHLLLDLSPEKRDVLLKKWHEAVVRERLGHIGVGLVFVLICLATLLGYLRLDDATRGYYSRWLFSGALAIVAGSAAAIYTWIV